MRTILSILFILAAQLAAEAKLNVVATTEDFGAIARQIGGDHVSVLTLVRPSEDPHFVDAKPSFIVKLNRADVLIDGGAELESGWLPPLLDGARNAKLAAGQPGRVECARGVEMLEIPATLDRAQGDLHAAGNPHYMTDPLNGRIAARHICDGFCRVDAANAAAYRANLRKFSDRIDAKLDEWRKRLEPFKGRRVAAYHNSWPYFARRFGIRIDLFLEPKPGIPPTPANLASVIATMKTDNVRVVIVDPFQNRRTAEAVANETGATVVNVAQFPGGVKGTEGGYVELFDHLVASLAAAMGK